MLGQLEGKLLELVEAIERGVVEYGPEALELALAIIRVEGIGQILIGLFFLAIAIVGAKVALRVYGKGLDQYAKYRQVDNYRREPDDGTGFFVFTALSSIVTLLSSAISVTLLLNIWNWVAIFYPELKLAYEIYRKVVGQ